MNKTTLFKKFLPFFFLLFILSFASISFLDHLFQDIRPYVKNIIFSFILTFIAIIFHYFFSKSITVQLSEMAQTMKRFVAGDFSQKLSLNLRLPMEFWALGRRLNKMGVELNHQLKKVYRQRSEREAIFSGMIEGVLSIYMDGTIFHWNHAVCNYFNVPYPSDLKGRDLKEIFRHSKLFEIIEVFQKNPEAIDEEIQLNNGKILQVHVTIIKKSENSELGILLVFNDITHLRKLENHRKDFVANVSHELRTPLTSIKGYIETLIEEDDIPLEMRQSFHQKIKRNTDRLNNIIEDLLALSEIDREQERELFKQEDLNIVLKNTIFSCKDIAHKKGITLKSQTLENKAMASVNTNLLEQALRNLIENAIKYGPENSAVLLKLVIGKDFYTISVEDTGIGIKPEHLPRIFERFYSPDKARSRELGGSGLGLSIVKNIAALHHGNVSVTSEVNIGSKFKITIPLTKL